MTGGEEQQHAGRRRRQQQQGVPLFALKKGVRMAGRLGGKIRQGISEGNLVLF